MQKEANAIVFFVRCTYDNEAKIMFLRDFYLRKVPRLLNVRFEKYIKYLSCIYLFDDKQTSIVFFSVKVDFDPLYMVAILQKKKLS